MITLESVGKYNGTGRHRTLAFSGVNLTIRRGRAIGILGAHGSGKTTLIGIVNGNHRPDIGRVTHDMSASWSLTSRETFNKTLPVLTSIRFLTQMYGAHTPDVIERTCEIAGLKRSQLQKTSATLSRDLFAQALIAVNLALEFDCYVVDEHLVIGSRVFRRKLMERFEAMKSRHAFVIATRNVQLIREFCDEAHVLADRTLLQCASKGEAIRRFKDDQRNSVVDVGEELFFAEPE